MSHNDEWGECYNVALSWHILKGEMVKYADGKYNICVIVHNPHSIHVTSGKVHTTMCRDFIHHQISSVVTSCFDT